MKLHLKVFYLGTNDKTMGICFLLNFAWNKFKKSWVRCDAYLQILINRSVLKRKWMWPPHGSKMSRGSKR